MTQSPRRDTGEVAGGTHRSNPAAVDRALRGVARADGRHEVLMCVTDQDVFFLEGRVGKVTFAASLQLDADGAVARSLCFRCPLVPAPPPRVDNTSPWVLPLLERYFRHLGEARFDEASVCFSNDCLYSHPPYRPGEPRAEFRGREQLHAGWVTRRGTAAVRGAILRCVQNGSHAFIEGVANGGSFVSSIALDPEGLICRYVAFHARLRAPRHGEPA